MSGLPSAAAALGLRDVTKRYRTDLPPAVDRLTLDVPAGGICILVGPSGCGKSTALRMINRLIEPSSGEITIDGRDSRGLAPAALRRRIGYVIQRVGLLPHLSVAANVATVPKLLGWDRQRIDGRVEEMLALVRPPGRSRRLGYREAMTGPGPDPAVRIIRSSRRRRSAAAREVAGAIELRVPAGLPAAEEARLVDNLVGRITRRRAGADIDLAARAARLARRYGLPRPVRIDWADNQSARWGSCTPGRGTVRISRRLAGFPGWVLDYVIVHELAHLTVHRHGPAFWELVNRYPRAERARGFLIAKGLEEDGE